MASANTLPSSARPHSTAEARHGGAVVAVFVLAAGVLAALLGWLLARGQLAAVVPDAYRQMLALADAPGREALWLFHPRGIAQLGHWLLSISPTAALLLPCALDIAACAVMVALLWRDLSRALGQGWAWTLSALFLLQPLLLWAALTGEGHGVALLVFYGLCRTLRRFRREIGPAVYMSLAAWMCLFFFTGVSAWLVIAALAPWMLLVVPAGLLPRAPFTFHLAVFLPLLFVLLICLHLGLLLEGDALALLRGAWTSASSAGDILGWGWQAWAGLAAIVMLPLPALTAFAVPGAWRTPACVAAALASAGLAAVWLWGRWPSGMALLLLVPAALALREIRRPQRLVAGALLLAMLAGSGWILLPQLQELAGRGAVLPPAATTVGAMDAASGTGTPARAFAAQAGRERP